MSTPDELRAQAAALEARAAQIEKPMTEAEVKTLLAEKKYSEIQQARIDGRLAGLLGPINPEGV